MANDDRLRGIGSSATAAVILLLAGCWADFPDNATDGSGHESRADSRRRDTAIDVGEGDGPPDSADLISDGDDRDAGDGGEHDVTPDVTPDSAPDVAPPDLAPDLAPDVTPDVAPPDLAPDVTPDLSPPDLGVDQPVLLCTPDAFLRCSGTKKAVFCNHAGDGEVEQNCAPFDCNPAVQGCEG